jgi:glycosyltransferase involved in cell wall biosynthesis
VRTSIEVPVATATRAPSVSVVVPCYNYGRFLPACVASALEQPGVEVEVIVVDDASKDDSAEVCQALAAADPRVVPVRHRTNYGHLATYNDGFGRSSGDYVMLLSADDLLAPGALQRATALMETCPEVGFVFGQAVPFSGAVPPTTAERRPRWRVSRGPEWAARQCRRGTNRIYSPEVVMRTRAQRRVGGFRATLPHTADLCLWLDIASVADVGYVAGPVQGLYRVHPANMHTTQFSSGELAGMVGDLRHRWAAFASHFTQPPAPVQDAQRLLATAAAALAREALDLVLRAYTWGLTDRWPIDELRAFALEVEPGARSTWRWHLAERLERRGARRVARHPVLMAREHAIRAAATVQDGWLARSGA